MSKEEKKEKKEKEAQGNLVSSSEMITNLLTFTFSFSTLSLSSYTYMQVCICIVYYIFIIYYGYLIDLYTIYYIVIHFKFIYFKD